MDWNADWNVKCGTPIIIPHNLVLRDSRVLDQGFCTIVTSIWVFRLYTFRGDTVSTGNDTNNRTFFVVGRKILSKLSVFR